MRATYNEFVQQATEERSQRRREGIPGQTPGRNCFGVNMDQRDVEALLESDKWRKRLRQRFRLCAPPTHVRVDKAAVLAAIAHQQGLKANAGLVGEVEQWSYQTLQRKGIFRQHRISAYGVVWYAKFFSRKGLFRQPVIIRSTGPRSLSFVDGNHRCLAALLLGGPDLPMDVVRFKPSGTTGSVRTLW
jgi:hypothetical protein